VSYLTKQQVFDNAYLGILKNGLSFATHPDRVGAECRYRLSGKPSDPIRCAIGHSIPDELYEESMENMQVTNPECESHLVQVFKPDDADFLCEVLMVHDNLTHSGTIGEELVTAFTSRMLELVTKYDLTLPTGDIT
jgi:hypothetical protein